MTNFIEEFYYGNIDPQARSFEQNKKVQRDMQILTDNEDFLTDKLSGEEKKRFIQYVDAWASVNGESTLDSFITGFRLGAQFVFDTFVTTKAPYIHGILTRQEYCGDVLNFKTHSKSFKNHRRIDNPKEDWMVFEDRHEAIIERDTYKKVQKRLKSTHQRAPKEENGPKSIFCDILRCADCGSKMWYHTNSQNRDIHYFSCSNYVKDYRGTCLTRHYIRADAVEAVVEMELRRLAEYLIADENRFAEILARKSNKQYEIEKKTLSSELRKSEMRIEMLPKLLKTLYEDKVDGKTSEDDYNILSREYAEEREQLKKKILNLRRKLTEMNERESEREEFIRAIRKFMEMRTLTKQVLNELIDHIDVYEVQGTGKNKTQRLVIYYKFVGYLDIDPTQCHPNYTADIREGVAVEYVSCEPSENLKELFPEQYGEEYEVPEDEETEQA